MGFADPEVIIVLSRQQLLNRVYTDEGVAFVCKQVKERILEAVGPDRPYELNFFDPPRNEDPRSLMVFNAGELPETLVKIHKLVELSIDAFYQSKLVDQFEYAPSEVVLLNLLEEEAEEIRKKPLRWELLTEWSITNNVK